MRAFAGSFWLLNMWPVLVVAQLETAADALQQKFAHSVTHFHQEKVFIHTDKPFYFTGETIWFKAYCVDASFHTLSPHSRVLYVELINSKGHVHDPVLQENRQHHCIAVRIQARGRHRDEESERL